MNPFQILGLLVTATIDEARQAYRRLAQIHHPDKGGSTAKFQEIQGAWELIQSGWRPEPPKPEFQQFAPKKSSFTGGSKPEPVFKGYSETPEFKKWQRRFDQPNTSAAYRNTAPKIQPLGPQVVQAYQVPKSLGEFIARVSLAEAYFGFTCEVDVKGTKFRVQVPKGAPHGLKFTVPVQDKNTVTVTTLLNQNVYKFVGLDTALKENVIVNSAPATVYRTKDLRYTAEISSRDLSRGKTLELIDFLGAKYSVKVPPTPTHDPRKVFVVPGHGYVDWYSTHSAAGEQRGSVIVSLRVTEEVPFNQSFP